MSKLRPEVVHAKDPAPDIPDSYWLIRDSVRASTGLAYGKLHDKDSGFSCAVGSFFDRNKKMALPMTVIDEVAAINDSIPSSVSPRQRRRKVLEWLNWKIKVLAHPALKGSKFDNGLANPLK